MKKLFFATLICLGLMPMANAQETDHKVTQEDYERMIENMLEVEFRSFAIKTLELTEDEIIAFDPLYREYMNEKSELVDKKFKLMEKHGEEYREEEDADDKADEVADFIENYWEVEIAEMELKKDYFDKLEDKIDPQKAFDFFLLEDMVQNRMKERSRTGWVIGFTDESNAARTTSNKNKSDSEKKNWDTDMADKKANDKDGYMKDKTTTSTKGTPSNVSSKKAKSAVEDYNTWVIHHEGKVGLDHDYTHNGLTKLMAAATAIAEAGKVKPANFDANKQKVLKIADELKKDRTSDKHADKAREAFIITADMFKSLHSEGGKFKSCGPQVTELGEAARKLKADKLMTPQAEHIYNFFHKAQKAVNSMSENISWAGNY